MTQTNFQLDQKTKQFQEALAQSLLRPMGSDRTEANPSEREDVVGLGYPSRTTNPRSDPVHGTGIWKRPTPRCDLHDMHNGKPMPPSGLDPKRRDRVTAALLTRLRDDRADWHVRMAAASALAELTPPDEASRRGRDAHALVEGMHVRMADHSDLAGKSTNRSRDLYGASDAAAQFASVLAHMDRSTAGKAASKAFRQILSLMNGVHESETLTLRDLSMAVPRPRPLRGFSGRRRALRTLRPHG